MLSRRLLVLFVPAVLTACTTKYRRPAPPTPRDAMPVAASFGRAWDAVIDQFADQNIPIRTMERASGFIAAEPARVEPGPYGVGPHAWADCGSIGPTYYLPTGATYNVVVRGDSAVATVKVTARWTSVSTNGKGLTVHSEECSTRGAWETAFEQNVKGRAERAGGGQRATSAVIAASPPSVQQRTPQNGIQSVAPAGNLTSAPTSPRPTNAARPDPAGRQGSSATRPAARESTAPAAASRATNPATATVGRPATEDARVAATRAYQAGRAAFERHEWARAEESFREAVRLDGSIATHHAGLGSVLLVLDRYADAEASYSAAVLLDVDNAEYRARLKEARSKR